ncbi:MAG: PAS domain S-box protein [Haloarculaceae archaeon]
MTDLDSHPPESADATLLLVMQPGRDRELLAEWLTSSASYAVTVVDPEDPVPREYDLCLLDTQGLARNRSTLAERVEAADPVFLPHLLVTGDDAAERNLDSDGPVDDVVTMPLDQVVFRRRLENFLQARDASLRLAEREEQYQQLVELTPEALLVVRDGEVRYANAAAVDTFGVDEPAALDGPVIDLVADEDRGDLKEVLETIDREGRLEGFRELAMVSATGKDVLAQVAGVTVTFEGEPATQLLVRDVTDQRKRQRQLSLFGKAIETARQGITIADARQEDEPLIYVNEAFEQITGYPTGEVLGRNCRFLQGPETDEETVAKVRDAVDDRRPVVVELLNYRKDGTPFWNRLEVVPVRDETGEVTHFLGLQRDVTQRREREERLAVLDRVLRHNIRNRMNVIRSRAELLREEYGDDSIGTIIEAADDLIGITEQIRHFQSLVSVEDHDLEPRDLVPVLEVAVADLRERHPDATVRLECPQEAVAEVHATLPAALGQVLEFAASRDGVPEAATPNLTVRVAVDGESVRVELLDHAGTIPHDDLEAIGRGSERPLQHSRGLELWLIRWAVLTSEGSLSVEEFRPPEHPAGTDREGASDPAASDREAVGCLRMRFRRAEE